MSYEFWLGTDCTLECAHEAARVVHSDTTIPQVCNHESWACVEILGIYVHCHGMSHSLKQSPIAIIHIENSGYDGNHVDLEISASSCALACGVG